MRAWRVWCTARPSAAGSAGTVFNLLNAAALNHQVDVQGGVLAEGQSASQDIFQSRRGAPVRSMVVRF